MNEVCLQVEGLEIGVRRGGRLEPAVSGVSFELRRGEMLALLGESGSGKSLTALSLMDLLPAPAVERMAGTAYFNGVNLFELDEEEYRRLRGDRIAMIFQEPMTALNPVMTVGKQLEESLRLHCAMKGNQCRERAVELLKEVEIPEAARRVDAYPHELSGGLRQRVMIAMALAVSPDILIADEPTTALDVTVQAQIMGLLRRIQQRRGMAVLFITHNIALAAQHAHRCAVMYAGQLVECAPAAALFRSPRHPYSRLLFQALPRQDSRGASLATIAGSVPRRWNEVAGCRFAPRCPFCREECTASPVDIAQCGGGVLCRCRRLDELPTWQGSASEKAENGQNEAAQEAPLLEVRSLKVHFPVRGGGVLKAVDGVDLHLLPGETLALVGESGCGKSTVGKALIRLLEPKSGSILLGDGKDYASAAGSALKPLRKAVQMIFQDPFSSLDPRLMVGESIAEGIPLNHPGASAAWCREEVARLLTEVGLDPEDRTRYPHQFSGGQRQRIGLARVLAVHPKVVVCDECTSALDVSVQAQILNLLKGIQRTTGVAYLFITHDLSVVGYLADRVAVMYLGRIVEEGRVEDIYSAPAHPYTRALLEAAPRMENAAEPANADDAAGRQLGGEVPSPMAPPSGCPFHTRCPKMRPECAEKEPEWQSISATHRCRCHYPGSGA